MLCCCKASPHIILIAALALFGCGPDNPRVGGKSDSGPPCIGPCVDWPVDAGPDVVDVVDPEVVRCEQEEQYLVPGWKLNREWSCACRLFDPEPGTEMPAWGRWEKCPTLGPRNVDCRFVVPPLDHRTIWYGDFADVDASTGRATLTLTTATPNSDHPTRTTYYVFDPDGLTRNAMIKDDAPGSGCRVLWTDMNDGKVALHVTENDSVVDKSFRRQAILGGDAHGPLSNLVFHWDPLVSYGWEFPGFVSSDLLVVATPTRGWAAADWSTMGWNQVFEEADGSRVANFLGTVVAGKSVFLGVERGWAKGIMSWEREHGLRPLLFRDGDTLEGTSNFGTDGKDMVWTQGQRDGPELTAVYDRFFLMTAPFSPDPAVVGSTARLVREERDGWIREDERAPYRVGCGYAAHLTLNGELAVTRLSDGADWLVERLPPPERTSWGFGKVLGVTCSEVFVRLFTTEGSDPVKTTLSIARIRIDSLGQPSFPGK